MELMELVPSQSSSDEHVETTPDFVHKFKDNNINDPIKQLIPGINWFNKIKRWIKKRIIVSRKHPMIKRCLKSSIQIDKEIEKQIKYYPWIIHPLSEFRNIWILLMITFSFVSLIILPFYLAFYINKNKWDLIIVLSLIDLGFIIDTFVCFFTGYLDQTTLTTVLKPQTIIRKYITSFFMLDLITAFPFAIILNDKKKCQLEWSSFYLLKIFRIRNVIFYFNRLNERYEFSFEFYKIIKMSIIIITCIHWAACMELYVPLVGEKIGWNKSTRPSWLASDYMKQRTTIFTRYVASANRASISLASSAHYLDMKSVEDMMLNIFLILLGRIGYIYVLIQFYQLVTKFNPSKKRNVKLHQELQEYMKYKELPSNLQKRIMTYFNYWCKRGFDQEAFVLENISPHLREAVLLNRHSKLIKRVEFFKYLPKKILGQIVQHLETKVYLKDDVIVKIGSIGNEMHYIVAGTVSISTKNHLEFCYLEDGSYFGELTLVIENQVRQATVKALETTEICVLKQSDFLRILEPYPNLLKKLKKLAIESLDKSLLREKNS